MIANERNMGESHWRPLIQQWVRTKPTLFPLTTDCLAWLLALAVGVVLKLAFEWQSAIAELAVVAIAAVLLQVVIGFRRGVYRNRWLVGSFDEVTTLCSTWLSVTLFVTVMNFLVRLRGSDLPTSAVVMGSMIALGLILGSRTLWRRELAQLLRPRSDGCHRTIVFGAGRGGAQMVQAMLSDPGSKYFPVALLDDDALLAHREIAGIAVEGDRHSLAAVARRHDASVLLIAIPSASFDLIQELSALASAAGIDVRVLPPTTELVAKMTLQDVRPPSVDDLLRRDPIEIDIDSVSGYLHGKRVLVTGAGGSIGSELSRQVASMRPAKLYLLDRDETALHSLQLSMEGRALLDAEALLVADVRDRERVFEIYEDCRPEVVFHTAALKHLTLLEAHPIEGYKTNVLGSKNLLDAAIQFDVERFVNISTDKAADPTSVLGATKLAAERLTTNAAEQAGLPFLSVRFGNVLGSRGSVLPTFLAQIEAGLPLTVTDPEATRFFMTIPEAVRLVIQAGAIGEPGEVLILDMGEPVKILDLANQLIAVMRPGTQIEFTGLRPGEKLHEALLASDEVGATRVHDRIIHTAGEAAEPLEALASMCPELLAEATMNLPGRSVAD